MTQRTDRTDPVARTTKSTTNGQRELVDLDARHDAVGGFAYGTLRFGVSSGPGNPTGNIPTQLG